MVYDRSWSVTLQNVTTSVFSDGTTKTENGAEREVPYKVTLDASPQVSTESLSKTIAYSVKENNDPVITVTRGSASVENVYEDRVEKVTQSDGSILHNTIRKTTTTTTTPVTTTKTYPKISVYTYEDGHSFTHDATDEVISSVENEVVVTTSEMSSMMGKIFFIVNKLNFWILTY